jgi:hypothetical protein
MTDADARSERRRPGTRLIGKCGQYRRGRRGVSGDAEQRAPAPQPRTTGPEQGRRDLPYARVPDSLLLRHSSTATLSVPRIGSRAGSVMLPDSLRQPPSPATRAEAPDERQRPAFSTRRVPSAGTTPWASCFAPSTSCTCGVGTAGRCRRSCSRVRKSSGPTLRRPTTETRC